jgi:hypothetical protein
MRLFTNRLGPMAAPIAAILTCFAFVGFSAVQGGGTKEYPDPRGEPKGFHAGETVRYAIWHNQHGWHVRTTTAKAEHHFRGHVRVEGGVFERIHSHDLEKEGRLRDWWKVGPERRMVTFEFKTQRALDGIDFRVSKSATRIHFNLHIDGRPQHERVFVGLHNQHPKANPFDLPAHP